MKRTTMAIMLSAFCGWCAMAGGSLDQTNRTQPLNIDLMATIAGTTATNNGVEVPSAKTVHITAKEVISALGASLGTTFATNAELLLTDATNGALTVTVKEGTNTAVDVSGYFSFATASNYIETVGYKTNSTALVITDLALESFGFAAGSASTTTGLAYSVTGVASFTYDDTEANGTVIDGGFSLKAEVSGSGTYEGSFALLLGTITAGAGGPAGFDGPGGPGGPGGFGGPEGGRKGSEGGFR